MKKIIYVIVTSITFTILFFNILSIYHVPFAGMQLFKVSSGSMEPVIKVNNLIIVKKQKEYHEVDIVTYKKGKDYINHRIVEIDGEEIITRGDANNTNDKPFKEDQIIGKYVYRFKLVAMINFIFKNPLNIFFAFIILLSIALIYKTIKD
jgi:signal peptidase I